MKLKKETKKSVKSRFYWWPDFSPEGISPEDHSPEGSSPDGSFANRAICQTDFSPDIRSSYTVLTNETNIIMRLRELLLA